VAPGERAKRVRRCSPRAITAGILRAAEGDSPAMTHAVQGEQEELARAYHLILAASCATHYLELAGQLGCGVEEARRLQRALLALGGPHWAHPGTDLIAGFAPFSSIATHYRISVDGEQRWFGQCGVESLVVGVIDGGPARRRPRRDIGRQRWQVVTTR
jgi:hypothetical protein